MVIHNTPEGWYIWPLGTFMPIARYRSHCERGETFGGYCVTGPWFGKYIVIRRA